jgi:hypothetical protein
MIFNINDRVKVKLTLYGRSKLFENEFYFLPEEDEDGWSEWQLWVLMEQLGKYRSEEHTSELQSLS